LFLEKDNYVKQIKLVSIPCICSKKISLCLFLLYSELSLGLTSAPNGCVIDSKNEKKKKEEEKRIENSSEKMSG